MMLNVNKYLFLGLLLLGLISCEIDDGLPDAPGANSVRSIAYLKSLYVGEPYKVSKDIIVRGVVAANDISGNLTKRLFVEDESGGIEIKLDKQKLYEHFFPGDSVAVYCGGLTIGSYGGMLQLGSDAANGYETDYIAESVVEHHVKLTGGEAPQRPVHKIAFDEVSNSLVGCFVLFDDVQFAASELNKNWTDNGEATNRTLIDEDGRIMVVRTNPTATFATKPLPSGSGSIGGIITVFNGVYQLMVADINDVNMYGQRF